jgi:hypothetical protein
MWTDIIDTSRTESGIFSLAVSRSWFDQPEHTGE